MNSWDCSPELSGNPEVPKDFSCNAANFPKWLELSQKGNYMDIEKYQYIFGDGLKNEKSLDWVIYQYLYYHNMVSKQDSSFYARLGRESTRARLNSIIEFYNNLRNEINGYSLQDFYSRKHVIENQLAIIRNSNSTDSLPMMYFGELILKRSEVENLISIKKKHDVLPEIEIYASLNIEELFEFLS